MFGSLLQPNRSSSLLVRRQGNQEKLKPLNELSLKVSLHMSLFRLEANDNSRWKSTLHRTEPPSHKEERRHPQCPSLQYLFHYFLSLRSLAITESLPRACRLVSHGYYSDPRPHHSARPV